MSKRSKKKEKVIRNSLNRKAFFITLALTLSIGLMVLVAGFLLYIASMTEEYFVNTWNQANAEAAVLEQDDYRSVADRIIKQYDSLSEEERENQDDPKYQAKFTYLLDDDFRSLQRSMRDLQNRNGPMNAFMVAIDQKADRMIYLVDADPEEDTFCCPGTWEQYTDEEADILVNGRERTFFHEKMGIKVKVQAMMTNQPKYGIRCTAGSTLYKTDKYTIMVCVDEKMEPVIDLTKQFFSQYVVVLVIITLIASLVGMRLLRRGLVNPVNRLAGAAKAYAEDTDKTLGVKHFDGLGIETGDEVENLASTLVEMENEVANYVDNLAKVTAERERAATELQLASKIQKSMLNEVFPPFPDRHEFDIYASMEPAKMVGGDFYDMFLIDEDHLGIVIADVSDKGVPAAIFMTAAKIVLADAAMEGLEPAEVLKKTNNRICKGNKGEMFVTVWLGILEISTGKLVTANAGHEYPILIHRDGSPELIHDKHGLVIGGIIDVEYTNHTIQMDEGDRILVYTDGVTEATKSDNEQFGMERLIDSLVDTDVDDGPEEIISTVRRSVDDFVGDAEQFDDLTMLCMVYKGK